MKSGELSSAETDALKMLKEAAAKNYQTYWVYFKDAYRLCTAGLNLVEKGLAETRIFKGTMQFRIIKQCANH